MSASDRTTRLVILRHGQTEWSLTGRHTGLSDLPLTDQGMQQAATSAHRLSTLDFAAVWTSPLRRATQTVLLAGFPDAIERAELREWDYGEYDGRTSAEIRRARPGWEIFRDGVPGGESLEEVAARADGIVSDARDLGGDILAVSHGHFSRVLAARWLGLEATLGRSFSISPASLSMLGWKREVPVILRWNDACHLEEEWCAHAVFPE